MFLLVFFFCFLLLFFFAKISIFNANSVDPDQTPPRLIRVYTVSNVSFMGRHKQVNKRLYMYSYVLFVIQLRTQIFFF